ncbi:glycosyltransferase family 9 protein [Actinokineospora soli]|uniref:Glycosyltransferase family 9 protein n=1 Tax=Actinokineospora soli TaxID=1048753 RepID=A0ABW2TPN5_9PSEU
MEPFSEVRRIAVLRGGGLGDLLYAMPAMDALAAAYPEAELVLLGSAMHAELLRDRPGPVSRVVPLPRAPGFDGEGTVEEFAERAGRFDLGVQVHGGGRESNPLLLALHPTFTVGSRTEDAPGLTRSLPFRYHQHEVLRALEVACLAGAPPVRFEPRIPVTGEDLAEARAVLGPLTRPLLVLHPGATDPRRRWQPERFAAVAEQLSDVADAVVIGTADEIDLADAVVRAAPRTRSLAGALSLRGLVGVLSLAKVVVANDSGPRHLAQAVGTPTVSVFWIGNVLNSGPFGRLRHRVHISWTARCPVCGADCTRPDLHRCAHDVTHVGDISVDDVQADVRDLLERD